MVFSQNQPFGTPFSEASETQSGHSGLRLRAQAQGPGHNCAG